jgi:hypothetical protein
MPNVTTVYYWLFINPAFADAYRVAREAQANVWADQTLEIADNTTTDMGSLARDKLRVETRKWFLARMAPRQYAERVIAEQTNLNVNVSVNEDIQRMTREERIEEARRIAQRIQERAGAIDAEVEDLPEEAAGLVPPAAGGAE